MGLNLDRKHEAAMMWRAAFRYAFPDQKLAGSYTSTNSTLQERLRMSHPTDGNAN